MPTTLNDITVSYDIMADPRQGTFRGKLDAQGREDTLTFRVAFSDLNTFLEQIKGKPTSYGSGSSATITRTEPLRNPFKSDLYAISANYRAMGSDDTVSTSRPWGDVFVDVTFGALQWFPSDPSQPYLLRRYRGASRMITIPGTAYVFSNGERREQDIGRRIGGHTIEVTRLELPSLDNFLAVAEPLEGAINSDTITLGSRTYAPGYLLYETFSADFQANGLGSNKAQATIVLQYSALPWNYDIRTSDGVVDYLTPSIYTASALTPLFS